LSREEEHLESLLDSISKARDDVDETYRKDSQEAEKKAKERAEIRPEDSFIEKSGLSSAAPKKSRRKNLRKALSEDEFLSEFENMLDSDDDEQEQEKGTEKTEDRRDFDSLPDGEDVSPYFSKIGVPEKKQVESPKDDLMDDISSIVSNAKEKAGESILSHAREDQDTKETDDGESVSDSIPSDISDTSAKDVDLMDESGSDTDLSDIISQDADLSDIDDMLAKDANGEELSESREAFEDSATDNSFDDISIDDLGQAGDDPDTVLEDPSPEDTGNEKKGFLAGLIEKIKNIFSADEDDDEKLSKEELIGDHQESPKDLSEENKDIMSDFSDDQKAEKGKAPKQAKPKKEKKPKAVKPKREKKPKPVDNSPLIPGKVIGVFVFLAVSIFALAYIGAVNLPKDQQMRTALKQYNEQDYLDAYLYYASLKNPDKVERERLASSKYAASLSLKYDSYSNAYDRKAYDFALDSLIRGYAEYEKNKSKVSKLDIKSYYDDYGTRILDALRDQFGLSPSDAASIYAEKTRLGYSRCIEKVLAEKGLSVAS